MLDSGFTNAANFLDDFVLVNLSIGSDAEFDYLLKFTVSVFFGFVKDYIKDFFFGPVWGSLTWDTRLLAWLDCGQPRLSFGLNRPNIIGHLHDRLAYECP